MLKTALIACTIGLGFAGNPVEAGPRYDVKIEQAAKKIVAKKIGDIRGGVETNIELAAAEVDPVVSQAAEPEMADFDMPRQQVAAVYHSGRPEPLRQVRKVMKATSFLYY
ncbi:MAG: hypothetical protein WCC66_03955 [Rhizobiaceae bacterium]